MTVNALPICEFLPFLPEKKQNIDNFMSVECKIGSYSVHMGTTSTTGTTIFLHLEFS